MGEESQKFIAFREHLTGNRYGGKKYFGKLRDAPLLIDN